MDNKIREHSKHGDGFALLPWAEHFREGRMPNFPDPWIAVLPVIVAHANKNREAWPGYARLCALAQVSRTTLHDAISGLVEKKWITRYSRKSGRNTHNVYRLIYGDGFESRHWIALHHDMIFSGVWGKMRPSDRKVYLMLRAFGWRGGHAIPDGWVGMGACPDEAGIQELADYDPEYPLIFQEANFLPAHIYDPAEFQKLSGMNARTYRDSFSWLLNNGLVIPTGYNDSLEEGYLLPFRPGRHAPDIEKKVAEAELTTDFAKTSPGARRSLACARRRQRLNDAGLVFTNRAWLEAESTDKRQ